MSNPTFSHSRVRVWDLPTRLFHWLLAICLVGLFASAWWPGGAQTLHSRLGYAVLALLLFRLAWGVAGGYWSRWSRMVPSPGRGWRYLLGRGVAQDRVGHNPLGVWSVFALLVILGAQVTTGLLTDDQIAFTGPLNRFVSADTGLAATDWHKAVGKWLVLGWVGLHLAAIAWHQFGLRHPLVGAMVHGDRELPQDLATGLQHSRDDLTTRLAAAVVFAACVGVVVAVVRLGS
jgi:cytochrome b